MLYRLVRLALLAEALAYIAIGTVLHRSYGWPVGFVILAGIATALALRLGFVLGSFALGRLLAGGPGSRLGFKATLRLLLWEWIAVLGSNFIRVPFESWTTPPDAEARPTDRVPVVFVHGYFGNRGFFGPMMRWLGSRGVAPLYAPNLPGAFETIEGFAESLHESIERIAAATGQPRVVLVCHSMGGLASRRYLATHGPQRVAALVTIASPHAGTVLARFGLGRNAAQMRCGCDFLRALEGAECGRAPCPTTSIHSPHDNLVTPHDTGRLAFARNVALDGMGHITILLSPATFAIVLDALAEAGVRAAREA